MGSYRLLLRLKGFYGLFRLVMMIYLNPNPKPEPSTPRLGCSGLNAGALIIRKGFWGPLYYNYKRNPQNSIGNYLGPCSMCLFVSCLRIESLWFRTLGICRLPGDANIP